MAHRFSKLRLSGLILMAVLMHAQDSDTFIYEARQQFNSASENLLKSAEEMPAQDYGFRPTAESPSFGDWVDEAATSQSRVCSVIESKSADDRGLYAKDKAALVARLRQAIGKCDSAYSSVNRFTASQKTMLGNSPHSRLGLLFMNASHDAEVYGHMSDYLRLKGLVPPEGRARLLPVDSAR